MEFDQYIGQKDCGSEEKIEGTDEGERLWNALVKPHFESLVFHPQQLNLKNQVRRHAAALLFFNTLVNKL
jgi:hypothetical protein